MPYHSLYVNYTSFIQTLNALPYHSLYINYSTFCISQSSHTHYRIVNFRLHHLIQNLNPICCWCVFIRCMCISFSITNFATNLQLPFLVTLMKIIYDRFYIPLCILHTGWCGLAHPTTLSSLRAFIGGKKFEKRLLILDVQKKSHQIPLPISCSY